MTDKTSTAPVMSREDAIVRNLCRLMNSLGLAWAKDPEARTDDSAEAAQNLINYVLGLTASTPDVVGGDVVACRYRVVAPNGNVGKWFFTDEACVSSDCLEVQPLYAAPRVQGEIIAWVTPEGDRSISASQKARGERDGGASATSVRPFSVPAYAGLLVQGEAVTDEKEDANFEDGEQVAQWLYRNGMRNAAFVVRQQLDVRNNRIRELTTALAAKMKGDVSHPAEQTRGNGCPCEPSGSDGLSCPGKDGRLLCDPKHKPEQTRGDGVAAIPDQSRAALLWLLWHHLGGSSQVGQPIRQILGLGTHERMSEEQIAVAKAFSARIATPRQAVPDELIADLRKFHEETEACDEFDLTSEATAALLAANLIEGTHFVLTAKGDAMLAAAPSAGRMGVDRG